MLLLMHICLYFKCLVRLHIYFQKHLKRIPSQIMNLGKEGPWMRRWPSHCLYSSQDVSGHGTALPGCPCPGALPRASCSKSHALINSGVNLVLLIIFLGFFLRKAANHHPVSNWVGTLGPYAMLWGQICLQNSQRPTVPPPFLPTFLRQPG